MFKIMIEIICMETFKLPCFERQYILSHCCIDACCSISPLQSLAIFEMRSHAYGGKSRWKLKLKEKFGSKAPKFVVSAKAHSDGPEGPRKMSLRECHSKKVSPVFLPKTKRNACLQAATPDTHIAGHHLRFQCPRSQHRCFAFGKRESHHCACLDLCWPNAPQSVLRSRKPGGDVTGETPKSDTQKRHTMYIYNTYILTYDVHYIEWKYVPTIYDH